MSDDTTAQALAEIIDDVWGNNPWRDAARELVADYAGKLAAVEELIGPHATTTCGPSAHNHGREVILASDLRRALGVPS